VTIRGLLEVSFTFSCTGCFCFGHFLDWGFSSFYDGLFGSGGDRFFDRGFDGGDDGFSFDMGFNDRFRSSRRCATETEIEKADRRLDLLGHGVNLVTNEEQVLGLSLLGKGLDVTLSHDELSGQLALLSL